MAEIGQGIETLIYNKDNVAALAAVTPVRPSCRDIFSLRKETCPSPPLPLETMILALSINMKYSPAGIENYVHKQKAPGENCSFLPGALIVSKIDLAQKLYRSVIGNLLMLLLPAPQPRLPLQDVRKLSCGTYRSARNEGCRL